MMQRLEHAATPDALSLGASGLFLSEHRRQRKRAEALAGMSQKVTSVE